MAPGTVKLRESLQQSWRIYLVLSSKGDISIKSRQRITRRLSFPSFQGTLPPSL